MKSMYSILGVSADASQQQIESAYAKALAEAQSGSGGDPHDANIRIVALKEAYATLSNPQARQRHDDKLFGRAAAAPIQYVEVEEGFWNTKKVAILGLVLLLGAGYYFYNVKERERMRIAHEREIAMKALQLVEAEQKAKAAQEEARLQLINQRNEESRERQQRMDDQRARSQADAQVRSNMYVEQQAERRAAYERESQQRREQYETQNRLAREKAELRRLEYENQRGSGGKAVMIGRQ